MTPQGTVIGEIGGPSRDDAGSNFVADTKSEKFAFDVHIVTSRSRIAAEHADFKWFGSARVIMVAAAGIILVIPRRTTRNSMTGSSMPSRPASSFLIISRLSTQLRGAEVLVRWRKPDGTLILPRAFIPLMESSGLIRDLTRNPMQKVCVEAGAAIGRRPDLKISLNFAGKLFGEPTIVQDVRNFYRRSWK